MQRLEARKRKEKHDKALGIVVQGYTMLDLGENRQQKTKISKELLTGLLNMLFRLFRPFLI